MIRSAAAFLLSTVLAACGGAALTPAASPAPTATATQSGAASQSAAAATSAPTDTAAASPEATTPIATSAAPSPGPEVQYRPELSFATQFAMQVSVSGLNVRTRPTTSGASLGKAPKGSLFLVRDFPVKANGYTWYYGFRLILQHEGVLPKLPDPVVTGYDGVLTGWLAAGTSADPYLLPVDPRCPSTVDLANVESMLDSERVDCFGTDPIEVTGTFGCGGCGGVAPGQWDPGWLASPLDYGFLSVDPGHQIGPFALHFAPDGPAAPPEGSIIKVRGHFRDARSASCVVAPLSDTTDKPEPIASSVAKAYCAARFVVDSFDLLGTDPSFPPG